ncbi:MAG: helix-turn-helix domain-containing protein [Magnetococcales bacterium]|nr:helix-turn-helix domain-containing protein [Magnetococcales bacterium]MBF0157120.1 helix-turn-helix domain-containing protein [Magnetococcales bacterium]
MELSERMVASRKYANITQKELADRVGLSQTAVHKLESGASRSSRKTVAFAMACGVDPVWLATGRGEMLPHPSLGGGFNTSHTPDPRSARIHDILSQVKGLVAEMERLVAA